jgi:hypothetical protein
MQEQFLIFTESEWWLIPITILSALLSWILYSNKSRPWSSRMNLFLATLRFIATWLVLVLILNPIANLTSYEEERPIIAIAVDNSTSSLIHQDSTTLIQGIRSIQETLASKQYQVQSYDLISRKDLDQIVFDAARTNLNQQLKQIERRLANQNLAAIIQITDGIVTNGFLPNQTSFGQPIHTLGIGDTIPPKDIRINSVIANNIVYLGNLFNAKALISTEGFVGENVNLTVSRNGTTIQTKKLDLKEVQEVDFTIDAEKSGLFRYSINITPLEGEVSAANNTYDFYVDVIDGKENILIIAPAPHPDIRAIRSSLEVNENYATYIAIPGLSEKPENIDFDVVIYHNAFKNGANLTESLGIENLPTFYISTERPAAQRLTEIVNVSLGEYNGQSDNVSVTMNDTFSKFRLTRDLLSRFDGLPSLKVPFADYALSGPHDVLLYQQVGRITTQKPLLSFYDDGSSKFVLMMANGIWKWKLQEGAISGDSELFDELITKTIQYLSIRNDKKPFVVTPKERLFQEGEGVRFSVEIYDAVFDRVEGQPFTITVKNEADSSFQYSFVSDDQVSDFSLGNLQSGTYNFEAKTTSENKAQSVEGQFVVQKLQVENIKQQADHRMLKLLSQNTQGRYFHINEIEDLNAFLDDQSYSGILKSHNEFIPLKESLWVICLIILIASTEWFLRKYLGSY